MTILEHYIKLDSYSKMLYKLGDNDEIKLNLMTIVTLSIKFGDHDETKSYWVVIVILSIKLDSRW